MRSPTHCSESGDATGQKVLSVFHTRFGWFGLLGDQQSLCLVTIGHASKDAVRSYIGQQFLDCAETSRWIEDDWNPDLRDRLQAFCQGVEDDFADVETRLDSYSPFQQRVLTAVRRIPYGQTYMYSELASRIRAPRAARAVGNALAANRFPIIIPCHRVVAAHGRLGGFSAPQGTSLKKRLLELEAGQDN